MDDGGHPALQRPGRILLLLLCRLGGGQLAHPFQHGGHTAGLQHAVRAAPGRHLLRQRGITEGGQHQQSGLLLSQLLHYFQAVHPGQQQIHHHHIRVGAADQFQQFLSVSGLTGQI